MSFIKDFLNISTDYSGLLFESNQIKIMKVREENNNYFPIYWNTLDFDLINLMSKPDMILFFKKIRSNLKTNNINIEIIAEEKKTKEIISNLKIAGFQEINFVNWDYNIDILSINKNIIEKTIFAFFTWDNSIQLSYAKENHIYKREKFSWKEINQELIKKIFIDIDHKHIFISGNFKNKMKKIQNIFYESGIKVHIFNAWKNILSFEKEIPALFKNETHEYLKVISLTLPKLNKINFEEEQKEKEQEKDEKIVKKRGKEIDVNFIIKDKKENITLKKKEGIWKKVKNILNISIFETTIKKNLEKKKKIRKIKIFLPKPKLKLFLPRWKKNNKEENKEENENKMKNKKFLKKKNKHKNNKKTKIFLKKPKKNLFLPIKKSKSFWNKIIIYLNQPIFETKKKKTNK